MVAHFVAEFADQSVDVTIVNFVEPLVLERGLKHLSFEEDLQSKASGVCDSLRTPLLDPMPAEFTEGRGDSAAFRHGETFKISAPRKFGAIIELTCG